MVTANNNNSRKTIKNYTTPITFFHRNQRISTPEIISNYINFLD